MNDNKLRELETRVSLIEDKQTSSAKRAKLTLGVVQFFVALWVGSAAVTHYNIDAQGWALFLGALGVLNLYQGCRNIVSFFSDNKDLRENRED